MTACGRGTLLGVGWWALLAVLLMPAAAVLPPGRSAAAQQAAPDLTGQVLVSQRPDLRGCLLAAAATAMNLLDARAGRAPRHTYQSVWQQYDRLVPGFAADVYAYPYPWTIGRLVHTYGGYAVEAHERYREADTERWLAAGFALIVYLDQGKDVATHAVVLLEQNAQTVWYFDPWWGLQERPRAAFYRGLAPWVTVVRPAFGLAARPAEAAPAEALAPAAGPEEPGAALAQL